MRYVAVYLAVVLAVAVLDYLWLGILAVDFYHEELGALARRSGESLSPRWLPALLVYVLIPAGIVLFVRPRLRGNGRYATAFFWGATFGLILYGVYEFTNLAILEDWTPRMAIIDTLWGSFLCGCAAVVLRYVDLRWEHGHN